MTHHQARKILRELPSLVDVDVAPGAHITVCGDVHGQFYDLLHIFDLNGLPSADNPYLFNGDFVDRGSFSVEVILTLLAWKALEPGCMHLSRGNHESHSMNKMYGFDGEVRLPAGWLLVLAGLTGWRPFGGAAGARGRSAATTNAKTTTTHATHTARSTQHATSF